MKRLLLALLIGSISLPISEYYGAEPVKVFILAGDSSMEGHGQVHSLPHLGDHPKYGYLLAQLKSSDGSWAVRDDVTVSWKFKQTEHGPLTVGWGCQKHELGPELMFGTIMGDKYKEHVLLIKTAWLGKDVYCDFRSPGAGEPCKEVQSLLKGEWNNTREPGLYYRAMISEVKNCLADIENIVPDYEGQGYVIAGTAWVQGWSDFCQWGAVPQIIDNYQHNLTAMIKDLRNDLNAPDMPFAICELGIGGNKMAERAKADPSDNEAVYIMKFRDAQKAVSNDISLKNVFFVPTADYWDDRLQDLRKMSDDYWNEKREKGIRDSRNNQLPTKELNDEIQTLGIHWHCHYNGSAANYSLIGYALAEALKN